MKVINFKTSGVLISVGLVLILSGCALQGDSQQLINVSADPEEDKDSAVVKFGDQKQFYVIQPKDAMDIEWSVDDILWFTEGTISTTGLYTAPSDDEDAPERVRIRATDKSRSSGIATAFLTTFEANVRISTNYMEGSFKADTYSAGQRGIALYKDAENKVHVYVVWADNSKGESRVWFSKSDDDGETFSGPELVDASSSFKQLSPAIAVDDDGNVYVVWEDYREWDADILIKKYDDSGFGKSYKVRSGLDGGTDYDTTPSIAIDSLEDIYVVWEYREHATDNSPWLYFSKSTNQGQTFSSPERIAPNYIGRRPAIAIDSLGNAYVVWEDLTGFPSSPTKILISKIEDDTPGSPEIVSSLQLPTYHARHPSVAVGPDNDVYVVWQNALILNAGFNTESVATYDISLAVVDGSTLALVYNTYSSPSDFDEGTYGGWAYPSITGDEGYIYLAWDDQRNGTQDIYFAKSSNGRDFKKNHIRIVNDETGIWHKKPGVAVMNGKAYVIWTDHRNAADIIVDTPISDVFFSKEE